jgi:hypothetical protein
MVDPMTMLPVFGVEASSVLKFQIGLAAEGIPQYCNQAKLTHNEISEIIFMSTRLNGGFSLAADAFAKTKSPKLI